jgi:hypothetical protein
MKKFLLWFLAFLIGASTMVYQRLTGPTYPKRGTATVAGEVLKYRLPRSMAILPVYMGGSERYMVSVKAPAPLTGYLEYKRYKTEDEWTRVPLDRKDDTLRAPLPEQPRAGKLLYKVYVVGADGAGLSLTGEEQIIIRFRGMVPIWILIPHVLAMLLAMVVAARAGLAALDKSGNPMAFAKWAAVLFFVAGFILGPLMQYYGFGPFWTGFPLGHDMTDNKTLVVMIGWIVALMAGRKGKPARGWILGAALLMFIVFLIPHSILGSELDYSKMTPPAAAVPIKLP